MSLTPKSAPGQTMTNVTASTVSTAQTGDKRVSQKHLGHTAWNTQPSNRNQRDMISARRKARTIQKLPSELHTYPGWHTCMHMILPRSCQITSMLMGFLKIKNIKSYVFLSIKLKNKWLKDGAYDRTEVGNFLCYITWLCRSQPCRDHSVPTWYKHGGTQYKQKSRAVLTAPPSFSFIQLGFWGFVLFCLGVLLLSL